MEVAITISGTRSLACSGRLVAGETAGITISGGTPAAFYLIDQGRNVIAVCTEFDKGAGSLNLATVPIASMVEDVSAGRAISVAALVKDADGNVIGYGFVPLVSAPMPEELEDVDVDLYIKASDIRALFADLPTDYPTQRSLSETLSQVVMALKTIGLCAAFAFTAFATEWQDVPADAPVDTNTVSLSYGTLTNTIAQAAAVPGTVSNTVTKVYVEGLGIEAGTDGETVTNIVREMGVPMTNGFLRVAPVASVNGQTGAVMIPDETSVTGTMFALPASAFPVECVIRDETFRADSNADLSFSAISDTGSGYVGMCEPGALAICDFDNGVFVGAWGQAEGLTFAGQPGVVGLWPVLGDYSVSVRGVAVQPVIPDLGAIRAGASAVAVDATNYTDAVVASATNGLLRTESDPRVPAWAKAAQKPSYAYAEISGTPDLSGFATTNDVAIATAAVASGVPGTISNTVTKTYVEDLGISGGLPPGIDVESLERAVQVGEDLTLIDAGTNGWVVAVSNIVEVGDVSVPGTLILGNRIYGAPANPEGRIDIDGCDFFYNRQIPGDTTSTNGYGNIVTDPYMEWRLARFFDEYNLETTRMWNQVATINNLPATLDEDLRAYNTITSNLESATMEVNLVRDEVNLTNAVMRATFDRALAEAVSSGEGWSATNSVDECLILVDHGVVKCGVSASSYYFTLPSWSGTPAHCLAWFDNAAAWTDNPPSFYTSAAGTVYVDEALPDEFYASGGKYMFDFQQIDEDTWFLSVHPAGVNFLGGTR